MVATDPIDIFSKENSFSIVFCGTLMVYIDKVGHTSFQYIILSIHIPLVHSITLLYLRWTKTQPLFSMLSLLKGDRKRKFIKLKVIFPYNLFYALKHIYKALSGIEYTIQQMIRFLSPIQRMCVNFCMESLLS